MLEDINDIVKVRRFLKERLMRDTTTFRGHESERNNVLDLLKRTVELGESNSLLLIGPRGSGKTTVELVNSVLAELMLKEEFHKNALLVHLNGNLHTDDRLALKDITLQMQLENAADGKVFGSFAENLAFLLDCLKAGGKSSKSVLFILEEFDLFCGHHNQTLLYNLFDVSQSAQAPICVLGQTCRLDIIELLEKRVKSRFSHRQLFIYPESNSFDKYLELFREFLSIPKEKDLKALGARVDALKAVNQNFSLPFLRQHFNPNKYKFSKKFRQSWNESIVALAEEKTVQNALQSLYDFDVGEAPLKTLLFRLIASFNENTCNEFIAEQLKRLIVDLQKDDKVELLIGLSVLELCLVIAIKHHSEIYDRDPFNFEIIHSRFSKFANVSSSMQGIERPVVLKAFEHLRNIEFILPLAGNSTKVQKEFEMHKLALTFGQINQAVQKYHAPPTEVIQWAQSSIL